MPRFSGETLKIKWDQLEIEKLRTIKEDMGVKSTPELVRFLVTEKYKVVTGSAPPTGRRKPT